MSATPTVPSAPRPAWVEQVLPDSLTDEALQVSELAEALLLFVADVVDRAKALKERVEENLDDMVDDGDQRDAVWSAAWEIMMDQTAFGRMRGAMQRISDEIDRMDRRS